MTGSSAMTRCTSSRRTGCVSGSSGPARANIPVNRPVISTDRAANNAARWRWALGHSTHADRMAAQSAKIEAGHVYLPKSAAWLGEFLTELLSFPNGRHDDQVDSVSQFLRWLQDDALNQISFHVPFVVSRPREFLPP